MPPIPYSYSGRSIRNSDITSYAAEGGQGTGLGMRSATGKSNDLEKTADVNLKSNASLETDNSNLALHNPM